MLTDAALVALASGAQAAFAAATPASTCVCFSYHTFPNFKPGTAWMTFTELDETALGITSGPTGLYDGNDLILAKYRLPAGNPNSTPTNAAAQAYTQQMRTDKATFVAYIKAMQNRNLGGLVLALGQKLHIASSRGGPYDVLQPTQLELSWECTITSRQSRV